MAPSTKKIETSLTHLSKKFVKLLNSNPERVVNLNEASTRLNVAKRRIYDITNVLEGIGLLQKTSKNQTRWVDCPRDSPLAAASGTTDTELSTLLKTYQSLEEGLTDLESKIRQQLSAEGAYVTYHDIKSSFNDQTVIAVKAPPETRLEVNEHLQIAIKSENGEIEVYLYQHNSNNLIGMQQQQQQQQQQQSQQQQQQQQQQQSQQQQQPQQQTIPYTSISSDEGRGRSAISNTDGPYYDPTSGVSTDDHHYNDPTLSSALSDTISEDEDPFKPLVPFEGREETHYNFVLDDNYTITSLFPEDNLGLY